MTTYTGKPAGYTDADLDFIFNAFKIYANAEWSAIMANYTPPFLQTMLTQFEAQNGPAVPANMFVVSSGGSVAVTNSAGSAVSGSPGGAIVGGGVLSSVRLTV